MIRAVLYDVGGTLHEVRQDPARYGRFSRLLLRRLEEGGVPLPVAPEELTVLLRENAEAYKHWSEESRVELPAVRVWNEFYLRDFSIGEDRLAPLAEELSVLYDTVRVQNIPRPHLRETAEALHGMGMVQGIISNIISTTLVPRLMEDYGLAPYLSCIVLSSAAGVRKPDPAIFRQAAAACGVPCQEMAYVGDTLSRDVLGCRNAGVALSIQIENPAIAHRDAAFQGTGLAPDARISDLGEIPGLIRTYNRSSER